MQEMHEAFNKWAKEHFGADFFSDADTVSIGVLQQCWQAAFRCGEVFGDSVAALRSALLEHGVWERTLVLTYSEFGRRPRENQSGGTDHGTAGTLFAFGPQVRGGLHGEAPPLRALDAEGNLRHTVDFRRVYAAVLEDWWQLPSERVLQRRFEPLKFIA